MVGRLPDWLGIGCVKCGTSWAWRELAKHPQVYSPTKELNYFNYKFPLIDYIRYFDGREQGQLLGEWTPDYFHHCESMHNIYNTCPWVKMIVIFRHPVERAFSNYKHAIFEQRLPEGLAFSEAKNKWRIRKRSIYSVYLKRWHNLFRKEQIKVLIYEDIKIKPVEFMQEIYRFLEIDDTLLPNLEQFKFDYHSNPINEMKLSQEDRQDWLKFYLPYTEQLEEMIDKDLSHWKL